MYAVVLFTEKNEVEAVPKCWLYGKDKSKCYWPPYKGKQMMRAIEQQEVPDPEWDSYDVILLKEKDDFSQARKTLKKAADGVSDLATTDEDKKRRRKPVTIDSDFEVEAEVDEPRHERGKKRSQTEQITSSDSEGPASSETFQKSKKGSSRTIEISPPSVPAFPVIHPRQQLSYTEPPAYNTNSLPVSPKPSTSSATMANENILKKLLEKVSEVQEQVRQNTLILKSLHAKQSAVLSPDLVRENFHLPMRTGDDFAQVEEKLSERESEAILVMINPGPSYW
ncbi:uncharacterized protein LOC124254830 isoform X3 [Haliotis rubra]|uniref:uncharacterized protein LOC124254830 isoform X3 n=1 Tax=Haliotis rubra TaxID=36100 RepID=UPI001EE6119F|nr:uncharacterized protein LOC124254830 isoform X3 [Haliotis rubra]